MDSIYNTRKLVKGNKGLSKKQKDSICNEMKDYILDRNYGYIKTRLIKDVVYERDKKKCLQMKTSIRIFGAYYNKNGAAFDKNRKEDVYIECLLMILSKIVSIFNDDVYVIYDVTYDELGKSDFDKRLKQTVMSRLPVIGNNIQPGKSNSTKEIQVADVLVGCMRRSLNNQDLENYNLIKDRTVLLEANLP